MTSNPWDRLESEPEAAWQAFRAYRDMHPPRRYRAGAVTSSASTSEISRWYSEWRWKERCVEYDRHLDKIRQDEREAILKVDEKERAARHLEMLGSARALVQRELDKLVRDSEASEASGLVRPGELNRLMTSVVTLERLVHGESTEVQEVKVDLSRLTVEELRTLQALQAKISQPDEDAEIDPNET